MSGGVMKLRKVIIHNFRGIIDQTIDLFDYTLLVGANNSGKSTAINALRVFYEKDLKFNKERDFPKVVTEDEESWVELRFLLTEEEYDSLAEEYQTEDHSLHLRKYFMLSKSERKLGYIYGRLKDGSLNVTPFYGAKNVQEGKIGDLIFVPAVSKVDEHTKLSGPSALRDLLSGIMSDVVGGSEAYQSLTESVQTFASTVKEMSTTDEHSLGGFERDINEIIAPWETKFDLNFGTPSTAEIVKSMIGWSVTDAQCGAPQDISCFGSGFQRHFIYSLIRLAAKYIPTKISKKSKDFTPRLNLILFEEPEAFLHPPQQEDLARNLVKMTKADEWQVVCSTHSANFVNRNSELIPALACLQRVGGVVSIHQIDEDVWNALVDANQEINKIAARYPKLVKRLKEDDTKKEMEAIRYSLWLNPDRASMFFANHVLLVEGPSETALLNRLIDEDKLEMPSGTYVMDCLGKLNIHRFMNLLNATGVTHTVLCDDDGDDEYHREVNQLIKDSQGQHSNGVIPIPGNLEKFLGMPPAGAPHRKPQHVMFCYSNDDFEKEKLRELCAMISKAVN